MTTIRKKWMLVWKINVDNVVTEHVASVLSNAERAFGKETAEAFFETKVLCMFIPVYGMQTTLEVHEIILDAVGYDKYETVIKNNKLDVQEILDQLKELLDVEK